MSALLTAEGWELWSYQQTTVLNTRSEKLSFAWGVIRGLAEPDNDVSKAQFRAIVAGLDRAINETTLVTLEGDDPAQEAYEVLEELRGFTGTKKAMLKLVSDYFGDDDD